LQLTVAEGATEIDLLAALGGRLDQTLANLLLLARPEWVAVRVRVIEGDQVAWVMRGGQTAAVTGAIGDTLSLVPLTSEVLGVTLDGVRWPLNDATLHLGDTLTISNTITAPLTHIRVGEGLIFVVHQTIGWTS
jgi:thiamine pyrophosphokinase